LQLKNLGVNIIGGCCGTTPEHIRKMAEVVKGEAGGEGFMRGLQQRADGAADMNDVVA
jgi:hypothetical protein